MKKTLLITIYFLITYSVSGQKIDSISTNQDSVIFITAEKMPEFKWGNKTLDDFVTANIKYPASGINKKTEGKVVITFIINNAGNVTSIDIVKGLGKEFDAEAIRIIKLTNGHWIPGYQDGTAVNVKFVSKVKFDLPKK